jgi:hypothetical protein
MDVRLGVSTLRVLNFDTVRKMWPFSTHYNNLDRWIQSVSETVVMYFRRVFKSYIHLLVGVFSNRFPG